jgi:hypothetical protein
MLDEENYQDEPVEEPQQALITIDDVAYLRDSLGSRGENIIIEIQRIDQKINELQFDLRICSLAKAKVAESLQEELPNFTLAPV